jgi:hypothetical protein
VFKGGRRGAEGRGGGGVRVGGDVKWCEEAFERLGAVVGQVGASGGTGLLGGYSHYPAVALQHNVLPLCSGFTARGLVRCLPLSA